MDIDSLRQCQRKLGVEDCVHIGISGFHQLTDIIQLLFQLIQITERFLHLRFPQLRLEILQVIMIVMPPCTHGGIHMLHLLHLPVKYLILIFLQLLFIAADHQLIIEYEHKLHQCPDKGGIRQRPGQQDKNWYDDMQDILPCGIHDKNKQKKCGIQLAISCIQECRKDDQGSCAFPQQSVFLLP